MLETFRRTRESIRVVVAHYTLYRDDLMQEAELIVAAQLNTATEEMPIALAVHRPLGSVNRARLAAYRALAQRRRSENGKPTEEIANLQGVPA